MAWRPPSKTTSGLSVRLDGGSASGVFFTLWPSSPAARAARTPASTGSGVRIKNVHARASPGLSSSPAGRDVVFDRAKAFATQKSLQVLPLDQVKRDRRVARFMRFAGEAGPLNARGLKPMPDELGYFERFLRRNGVAA